MRESGVGSRRACTALSLVALAALTSSAAADQPASSPPTQPPTTPPTPPATTPPPSPADEPAPPADDPFAGEPGSEPAPSAPPAPSAEEPAPPPDDDQPAPEIPQAKVRHAPRDRIDEPPPAAGEPLPPANYVGLFVGTSLGYRPPGGPLDVAPGDLNLNLGYGRAISLHWSLELDAGITLLDGDYASASLTPSAIYSLTPYAYAALRVIIPVDPEVNVALAPGLGLARPFGDNLAILELNPVSFVGKGDPDFALSLTAGLLRFF